jgi:flagellar basal-body rod modification protein FlgD
MSTVTSTTSAPSATTAPATGATGTTDLGENTFLKLLTTQMQNQDPLEPMSNEDFVAQLAQFSSLEELQGISSGVESLYLMNASMNNAQMVNLLGQEVSATGDTFHYDGDGSTELHFDSAADTAQTTITVTDSDGAVVWSGEAGQFEEGEGTWTWDGRTSAGDPAPAGDYTFSVTGTDAAGASVDISELIVGIVDEMSFEGGTAQPMVDGVPIAVGDILRVGTPAATGS